MMQRIDMKPVLDICYPLQENLCQQENASSDTGCKWATDAADI